MNVRHFQAHAARHAARWYKYALNEGGRDVSNGSLYLVTECTKSINWGISVFYANAKAKNDRHLMFDKGSCQWEIYRDKVDARVGPRPTDIILSDNDEPNQCVFLRGIKIMLRPDIWDELNGVIDVRCQDGESPYPPFTRTTTRPSSHQISGGKTDLSPSGDRNASGPSYNPRLQIRLQISPSRTPYTQNTKRRVGRIQEEVLRSIPQTFVSAHFTLRVYSSRFTVTHVGRTHCHGKRELSYSKRIPSTRHALDGEWKILICIPRFMVSTKLEASSASSHPDGGGRPILRTT